jgi:lipoate-protein ligase B
LCIIDYIAANNIKKKFLTQKIDTPAAADGFIFLEHTPVFTLGKYANDKNLLIPAEQTKIPLIKSERGGDITYHCQGQLVIYPIVFLDNYKLSIKGYVNLLEEIIIRSLSKFGINGNRRTDKKQLTGVFVKENKIASIGIAIRKRVTYHGIAININNDLTPFSYINPCGLKNVQMTSLKKETGDNVSLERVKDVFKNIIELMFGVKLIKNDNRGFACEYLSEEA